MNASPELEASFYGAWADAGILEDEVAILYDGECPVCSSLFTEFQRLRRSSKIHLLDARTNLKLCQDLRDNGIEVEDDFVLFWKGEVFWGGRALGKLVSESVSRRNEKKWLTKICIKAYPGLRWSRRFLLFILRRPRIEKSAKKT